VPPGAETGGAARPGEAQDPRVSGPEALAGLTAGGKPALARALAALETAPDARQTTALLDAALAAPEGASTGITGPPGVGKSTLLAAMIRAWRARGRSVGVLAVDPSSPASRGALLGDRTRLGTDPSDMGVFVRSMAARDRLGGLAAITFPAMVLMRALFDEVVVETVGVGQSETEIAGLCDVLVLCAQPGSGDALQAMKAGVMETPDIVLVTKADLGPQAARATADLRSALSLRADGTPPPVLSVSAARGEGIDELIEAIFSRRQISASDGHAAQAARWLRSQIRQRFGEAGLMAAEAAGQLPDATDSPFEAAAMLSARLEAGLKAAFG